MDVRLRSATRAIVAAGAVVALSAHTADASGHGPVFGGATPTLGKGVWQFDQAWMGQVMKSPADASQLLRSMITFGITEKIQISGSPADASQLLRSMITFGITEKIQISGSLPVPLDSSGGMPSGRMMAMMSGNRDFEALLGWRFQARPVGQAARLESTVYVGGLVPLDSERGGVSTSPAGYVAVASGYASRSHYFWAGASHERHAGRLADRQGAVTSVSLVYGYRPPAWRLEYPKPDLRFFIEAVADKTDQAVDDGHTLTDTGGRVALVGPTMLLLYKAYALEGGVLFPVYQRAKGSQPEERFRFGVNFTYFFFPGKGKGH